ncbi:MAG: bifunctional phosphoribosylaminoimidazolecarboxamide formyltransferase/IMP cyclohydrolase [Cyclobacteriaceae bacterium]|nr:bifunctional phosphoribosylaminoimidazolecarboxamide formyltransferase/IMP cyclohydrolase [Cyclobacteriaceae bacterium]MCX7636625.1 bifunctional phosphoribosylaminoimidazolecarboxamide formyltransferase/IMP cyclohydrolase [Cyclobacteriaceae bacterium]MDW8331859.1 bifunctional phosphoribosylaminoimidazolecarboxamide formyltransferase/IMP cyclohydrolase [Cyclobacteriaceae bacterium]
MSKKPIRRALVSVYNKEGLEPVIHALGKSGVDFVSTGGTRQFIESLGYKVIPVEDLTGYPSVFGGRVKTLHPAVFGGILYRRDNESDQREAHRHGIASIDLVLVDLYPFEETVAAGALEEEVIEKIDIGGVSLIRAAAKNYKDVLVVSSRRQYARLLEVLEETSCMPTEEHRRQFAVMAFDVTSHYDTSIFNWFNQDGQVPSFKKSIQGGRSLRYGENPHQWGKFYGPLDDLFEQLHGKELSYNNLVDIDAACGLLEEFSGETAFVIIKHTNACGVATGTTVHEAYVKALQADPVSAFGGILATNKLVDAKAAEEINKLFFEILIAPAFSADALNLLTSKKNRILLVQKKSLHQETQFKSLLNGVLEQQADNQTETEAQLKVVTHRPPTPQETAAMLFASRIAKHSKSNTIVLAVDGQMLASGVGQTSRVDALKQAIEKAKSFGFSLQGAVMASDAFFPFADSVEIAHRAGITAVIQPGGSVRDQESIDFCNAHNMAMVFTGYRHFRH